MTSRLLEWVNSMEACLEYCLTMQIEHQLRRTGWLNSVTGKIWWFQKIVKFIRLWLCSVNQMDSYGALNLKIKTVKYCSQLEILTILTRKSGLGLSLKRLHWMRVSNWLVTVQITMINLMHTTLTSNSSSVRNENIIFKHQ